MPELVVIAGCNGSGKSTFASTFLAEGMTSFDYDRLFLEKYNSLPDSELREEISRNETTEIFEAAIQKALISKSDFCYETNFDSHPMVWPTKFKDLGYQINLIFFCLQDQEIAKHRVQVRTEFKGHFVDDKTIDLKWREGYKNVNLFFREFDNILFVDNSVNNEIYINLLQILNNDVYIMTEVLPEYFEHRLPDVYRFISKSL